MHLPRIPATAHEQDRTLRVRAVARVTLVPLHPHLLPTTERPWIAFIATVFAGVCTTARTSRNVVAPTAAARDSSRNVLLPLRLSANVAAVARAGTAGNVNNPNSAKPTTVDPSSAPAAAQVSVPQRRGRYPVSNATPRRAASPNTGQPSMTRVGNGQRPGS